MSISTSGASSASMHTHGDYDCYDFFNERQLRPGYIFAHEKSSSPCQPSAADEALHWPKHVLGSEWLYIAPRPILYFSEMWFVDSSCFYYTVMFTSTFNSLFFFALLGQKKATHLQISPSSTLSSINAPHSLGEGVSYIVMWALPQQMGAAMCIVVWALPHPTPQLLPSQLSVLSTLSTIFEFVINHRHEFSA